MHWTLGSTRHTVHGTFAVKSGVLRIDPVTGKAGGEIAIDALSAESGNEGRGKKMHREIIECAKYKEIAFRPDRVDGNVPRQGSVTAQMHGIFLLHGAEHETTVPVRAEGSADHWNGTAKFTVPYIAWGLKSPSHFFLRATSQSMLNWGWQGQYRDSECQSSSGSCVTMWTSTAGDSLKNRCTAER